MGGKLFELPRVKQQQYLIIEKELKEYMNNKFPSNNNKVTFCIPRFYKSKIDFGDVDILLSKSIINNWKTIQKDIINDLNITKYQLKNDLSFIYKDLIQVDIMPIEDQYLLSTWQFLCYNDLGNLLGKHYRRFNLKYGERGLFYVYRSTEGNYKKDILLTRDMKQILGFLELSYEEWNNGFETLESMFEWVIACKYFTVEPFLKLSASTSKRIKLRTTMRKFVEYIETNKITKDYKFKEKHYYFNKIKEYFPEIPLDDIIQKEKEQVEKTNIVKSKFNGKIIMDKFPDIKGPELGKFITQFKNQYNDFINDIYKMSDNDINNTLELFYNDYKQIK